MANTPQAKKRIRRNTRRNEINGNRVSRIRTFVKKVEAALEAGDKTAAAAALVAAQPELARGGRANDNADDGDATDAARGSSAPPAARAAGARAREEA